MIIGPDHLVGPDWQLPVYK